MSGRVDGEWREEGGGDAGSPVKQVDRDAMRGLVVGATDPRDAAVGGHNEHRREIRLEGAVEVREAFDSSMWTCGNALE